MMDSRIRRRRHRALEAWELEDTNVLPNISIWAGGIHAWIFAGKDRSVAVVTSEAKHRQHIPASSGRRGGA